MSKTTTIILIVLGCLVLAVGTLSLWATLDVFNPSRFGDKVAEGLQSPEASQALAGPIVDRMLASYPELPAVAKAPAEQVVALLLQRPVFTKVFKTSAAVSMKVMTTSPQDVIGIDIAEVASEAGSTVLGVISGISPEAAEKAQAAVQEAVAASDASSKLAIYEEGTTPNLRQASNLAPWLALIGILGAAALFVWAYVAAQDQGKALKYIGWGIVVTSLLGFLILTPLVQAVAQNNIADETMQTVVGAVISALLRGYMLISLLVFFIGVIVLVIKHTTESQEVMAADETTADPGVAADAEPSDHTESDKSPAKPNSSDDDTGD